MTPLPTLSTLGVRPLLQWMSSMPSRGREGPSTDLGVRVSPFSMCFFFVALCLFVFWVRKSLAVKKKMARIGWAGLDWIVGWWCF